MAGLDNKSFADALMEAQMRVKEQQDMVNKSTKDNPDSFSNKIDKNRVKVLVNKSKEGANYLRTDTKGKDYVDNKGGRKEVYTDTGGKEYVLGSDGNPQYVRTDTAGKKYLDNTEGKKVGRVGYIPGVSKTIRGPDGKPVKPITLGRKINKS